MRVILIGSVNSSKIVLEEILKTEIEIIKVYALGEEYSKNVSGYFPIHRIANENGIPYETFQKINNEKYINEIEMLSPDYIFVVGLSQLVDNRIIKAAKKGTIGFHPTPLPQFRGRAAMVWQVLLGVRESKCTFFLIDEGMDSGSIIGQEEYIIGENDYAKDVENNLYHALRRLCVKTLERMEKDEIEPVMQDESKATYLLRRTPEDGKIDWEKPIEQIYRLIRGTSRPYPGAFSYYDGKNKVIIWHAECRENKKYIGMPGQIAAVTEDSFDVVCVDGLLHVDEYETDRTLPFLVGHRMKG